MANYTDALFSYEILYKQPGWSGCKVEILRVFTEAAIGMDMKICEHHTGLNCLSLFKNCRLLIKLKDIILKCGR